jgi:hypothetical protein
MVNPLRRQAQTTSAQRTSFGMASTTVCPRRAPAAWKTAARRALRSSSSA